MQNKSCDNLYRFIHKSLSYPVFHKCVERISMRWVRTCKDQMDRSISLINDFVVPHPLFFYVFPFGCLIQSFWWSGINTIFISHHLVFPLLSFWDDGYRHISVFGLWQELFSTRFQIEHNYTTILLLFSNWIALCILLYKSYVKKYKVWLIRMFTCNLGLLVQPIIYSNFKQ